MPKSKIHSQQQIASFLEELKSQTDRGTAVIAAAVLDDLLVMLLTARFIELGSERHEALFKRIGAPLSSFSARIEVCFAVGVISNEARLAMHLIREVRNEFAHRIEQITFDHPDVATKIETRMLQPIKKLGKNNREMFTDAFSAMALIIYSTLSAPGIRIKSLEETHQNHFVRILLKYAEVLKEAKPEAKGPELKPE
jgi:DNA-binding MltR family transcriptional regulator